MSNRIDTEPVRAGGRRELDGTESAAEALRELVETQGGRLFALGVKFCGSRQDADDLVQETFLQAYRSWDQFEGRSSAATWLYTIAARVCQRFQRRKAGEPQHVGSLDELLPAGAVAMPLVPTSGDDPLAEQIRSESREAVEAAIVSLPLAFRMPLVLKEIVGFSIDEVARITGLKQSTVKTRLHRARLRVRQAVERGLPQVDGPPPAYSREICMDLLRAKQEALDRGVGFEFPPGMACERFASVFGTLDLAEDLYADIGSGSLPQDVYDDLMAKLGGAA